MTLTIDQRLTLTRKRAQKRGAEADEAIRDAVDAVKRADEAFAKWKRAQERLTKLRKARGRVGAISNQEGS